MTKERLEKCNLHGLQKIAALQGIVNFEELSKEELIDEIIDAFSEAKAEHIVENNWTILSEEKKFDIFRDEMLPSSIYKNLDIPSRYNISKISLTMVDPLMAFVCWDLEDEKKALLEPENGGELLLRVKETSLGSDKSNFFDIPVKISDENWYINLPSHGSRFSIELILTINSEEHIIASSNEIISPHRISRDIENSSRTFQDDFLVLAGVYGFYDDENGSNSQKIVSFLDKGIISEGI